jgi:hypothetical protein
VLARYILWRLVGSVAFVFVVAVAVWALHGGFGRLLRAAPTHAVAARTVTGASTVAATATGALPVLAVLAGCVAAVLAAILASRFLARRRRRYVRWQVSAYRTDETTAEGVVAMFESLHKRLARHWWQRLWLGQPSASLEVHAGPGPDGAGHGHPADARLAGDDPHPGDERRQVWLAISCPAGSDAAMQAALRTAYPNCGLTRVGVHLGSPPVLIRLRKRAAFIKRVKVLDRYEHERSPAMNRLMTAMSACHSPAYLQIALTPVPASFARHAEHAYRQHERRVTWHRRGGRPQRDRSLYDEAELTGALELQHRPLFFADLRVVAGDRERARQIASELRAQGAENRLVERSAVPRVGPLALYDRRLARGEGNVIAPCHRGVYAPGELAAIWHLPSVDYATAPFRRGAVPVAPAPPGIDRPKRGPGMLRDAYGPVTIHESLRRGNVAAPGAVEQGKSSFLVASTAEDLTRDRCAVIVLDPKGDAAEAVLSTVPAQRTCTLLDFAAPTCGFNPLAASAPADVVADYVVGALRNLFTDADIRASSDRYLRNAIIAVLAAEQRATLWDAARLLSVGQEGYEYRARVGAAVRAMPEFKEISEFFTAELSAQLADARSMTTAKLDAPVNKLARLLNSASLKRILLNEHLVIDFDQVIAGAEVLVVKGALGAMGAGNTSVLMQMLVGMLDAALARQQDHVPACDRVAVALKIDEAPLVVNRGFAETMALKRSAGLETVACWQTDAQWTDLEVRDQLDALFAHRVYFATASVRDARASAALLMAEYSDSVRPASRKLSALGRPDARLHLPKHHAIVSLTTPEGRQGPFIATTIPLRIDSERIALHASHQVQRGGRYLDDLRQAHWDRPTPAAPAQARPTPSSVPPAPEPRPAAPLVLPARPKPAAPAPTEPPPKSPPTPPSTPAASYQELVDVDGAHSVRAIPGPARRSQIALEPLDLQILQLIASMRYVLSSQVHRRFNDSRAQTTTQRRMRRLAEAGLVERLQFHRRDGAGIPMCYSVSEAGRQALRSAPSHGSQPGSRAGSRSVAAGARTDSEVVPGAGAALMHPRSVAQLRHDLHVAGWVLALESALNAGRLELMGAAQSVVSPPTRVTPAGPRSIGPGQLTLAGGRTAHDFHRTATDGRAVDVEHFQTVRPDAAVVLNGRNLAAWGLAAGAPGFEVLVERDDRAAGGRGTAKLERYDHLLAGWSESAPRFAKGGAGQPVVVFICRDRARARACARSADALVVACQAYAGEYPADWLYPGRARIFFAAERDAHDGLLHVYCLPALPPGVRAGLADGDPRALAAEPQVRELPAALADLS